MKELANAPRILTWPRALLFVTGAVLFFHLAYAPLDFRFLKLFTIGYLVCLSQLARLRTPRQSFYTGLFTGMFCVAPQLACFWNIFGPAAIPLWLILSFWIALFVLLVHFIARRFGTTWAMVLVPFIWTGLEYFRSELYYLKFSWLNAGYAWAGWGTGPLHSLGVYGIGFMAALCGGLVLGRRWIFASALVLALFTWSSLLPFTSRVDQTARNVRVAGVQMEFPNEREIPKALDGVLSKYPNTDLLVLSEYTLESTVPESLKQWCRQNQKYLIVGGKAPAPHANFYDTGFVVGPNGQIVFEQVKSIPIQFFKDGLPAPQQALWDSPWGKIGICICYDLSYTRVTDRLLAMGAQFLVVPTMDVADWGKRQHQLHALIAPVRAAEYGTPIFRLASSGISQALDGNGNILAQAGFPGENEMLFAEIKVGSTGSLPLDRWLAPIAVAVTGATVIALMISNLRQRNQTRKRSGPTDQTSPSETSSMSHHA